MRVRGALPSFTNVNNAALVTGEGATPVATWGAGPDSTRMAADPSPKRAFTTPVTMSAFRT